MNSRQASENRRNIGGEMLLRKRRPAVICLLSTMEYHLKGIIKNLSLAWPALSGRLVLAAAEFRAKCSAPLRETLVGVWHRPFSIGARHPAEFPRSPVTNQQCSVAESVRSSSHLAGKNALREIRVPLRKQGDRSLVGSWSLVRRRR